MTRFDARTVRRFMSKVDVRGMDECWPWKASTIKFGYGQFSVGSRDNRKMWKAHRVAFILAVDDTLLEEGVMVLHKCDNPPCCNPSHLFPGTADDNNKDMVRKGRQVYLLGKLNPMWGRIGPMRGRKGKTHPWYGRKHSAATLEKMSKAQFKRWAKEKSNRRK